MVISRTPLRVSFVGGGSDLPKFARGHGGAVLSTAIDKYIHVLVTGRFEDSIRVSYSQTEIVDSIDEIKHELVREALRIAGLPRKVEIVTIADVPAQGTGLGSSSAVLVGVLNALFAYQGILRSQQELAEDAARIEIDVLGKPIGRQDHWAAAFGGLQLLRFGPGDEVRRDPAVLTTEQRRALERNLLMFYTGRNRLAGDILTKVNSGIGTKSEVTERLARKRDAALDLYSRLGVDFDPDSLGPKLHQDWELKRSLADNVSTAGIDEIYERARAAGALGGKLLGAGGGGFLLLYAPPSIQGSVRAVLRDLRELPFRFEPEGTKIVYLA